MKTLYAKQEIGGKGFGIEINVAAVKLPDLSLDSIQRAVYQAVKDIEDAIKLEINNADPAVQAESVRNRAELIGLFPTPIYVEEIPNGYCSDWCCRHLPWFIITTTIGRFTIGWRKQVISIDWSETINKKPASRLFPSEDVTKEDRLIHAWSLDKAKEYINRIISTA